MSSINSRHQAPGAEDDDDEEEEETEEEDEEEEENDDENDEDDAGFQISASSSAPGPLPLLSHDELRQSISSAPSSSLPPPPPPPESTSRAIIPFTGSFSILPSLGSKPTTEAPADSQAPSKASTADGHAQAPAVRKPPSAKSAAKAACADTDREPEKKAEGREHKKRSKNWTRAETLTLISLRTELAPRFAKAGRKSELWDEIADSMQKGPFNRDAQQCRDKWEKLMAGYKEVRGGLKHKDDNPYYEDLHPLLSDRIPKREREQDASPDCRSAKTDPLKSSIPMEAPLKSSIKSSISMEAPLKSSIPMEAPQPPPVPPQQYHSFRNLPVDGHYGQPYRAVLIDSHPSLTPLPMEGPQLHHPAPLSNLAMDGLPFRSLHAEAHYPMPSAMDQHATPAAAANDASEEQSHRQKRRKGFKYLSATDLRAVQNLLESILAKQQIFFKELLDGIERKEEIREKMRQEREEKWRAEERAQRLFFTEAMQILTQKLRFDNCVVEPSAVGFGVPMPSDGSPITGNSGLKKRSKNWKRSEVLQLIKLRGEMEEKFVKSMRRAALWAQLAEVLSTQGIRRDGKQCREKWDKLMSEYKDVVDGKKEKGDSPYFPELQAALVGGGLEIQGNQDAGGLSAKEETMNT